LIEIKLDTKGLGNILDPKTIALAASRAINEAARQTRTEASKLIRQKFNLPAARVNKEVQNIKLSTRSDLSAIIRAEGRPIGLTNYGATWVRGNRVTTAKMSRTTKRAGRNQGVSARIKKGQAPTRLPNAFIARGRRGKVDGAGALHVFQRRDPNNPRSPLINRATITIASMMANKQVMDRLIKKAGDVLERRFAHHLDRLMK
jgi:hypothetical protein